MGQVSAHHTLCRREVVKALLADRKDLLVVTMRGDWAEFNAWQNPMGQVTEASLNLMKVMTWRADDPKDVAPLLHGAATMAFNGDSSCALLLGQRLIGEKKWVK